MSNESLSVGDVVTLKTGGTKMTITSINHEAGWCECSWFDGSTLKTGTFEIAALKKEE